jgi:hypothetical protein
VLFEIVDDTTFYVWVSKNNANQTAQLLHMLRDGDLSNDIDWLLPEGGDDEPD